MSAAKMQELIELIELHRPGFASSVVGLDASDVRYLESVVGILPGAYRRLLLTMGADSGGFEANEASFKLLGIQGTYHQKRWLKNDRFLLVATDDGLSALDYYLDRTRPYDEDDFQL